MQVPVEQRDGQLAPGIPLLPIAPAQAHPGQLVQAPGHRLIELIKERADVLGRPAAEEEKHMKSVTSLAFVTYLFAASLSAAAQGNTTAPGSARLLGESYGPATAATRNRRPSFDPSNSAPVDGSIFITSMAGKRKSVAGPPASSPLRP